MGTDTLDRPSSRPPPVRPVHRWRVVAAFAAAVLVIVAVVLLVVTGSADRSDKGRPTPPAASGGPVKTAPSGTVPATRTASARTGAQTASAFRFVPLWPFATVEEAVAWQAEVASGGHQPWRLDADATALSFTAGFLGFGEVSRALGVSYSGDQAWVTVGYRADSGDIAVAQVHLARIGTGANRPWEVVGTRDTTLSLTTPRYGATVTSPVTMGGRITGVDESLRLQVRTLGADGVAGEVSGVAAGGENRPWAGLVSFAARTGTVLTLVVSTANHAGPGIGRFAVTGIRAG